MTQEYDVGDQVRLFGEFRDFDRSLADPSAVVAKVRTPAGAVTTYTYGVDAELTRLGLGHYALDLTFTASGKWYYRFEGTGDVTAAGEESITVRTTVF